MMQQNLTQAVLAQPDISAGSSYPYYRWMQEEKIWPLALGYVGVRLIVG